MAQRNNAVIGLVGRRRKREIKECPESSLELRRRREHRLVSSLFKMPFCYPSASRLSHHINLK